MYILAIETTGKLSSAALIDGRGGVVGQKISADFMSHLKNLVPMISELLDETGIEKNQLTHIAVSRTRFFHRNKDRSLDGQSPLPESRPAGSSGPYPGKLSL